MLEVSRSWYTNTPLLSFFFYGVIGFAPTKMHWYIFRLSKTMILQTSIYYKCTYMMELSWRFYIIILRNWYRDCFDSVLLNISTLNSTAVFNKKKNWMKYHVFINLFKRSWSVAIFSYIEEQPSRAPIDGWKMITIKCYFSRLTMSHRAR